MKPVNLQIPKPTVDNYRKSPWYKQNAFTETELKIEFYGALVITSLLYYFVGLKLGVIEIMKYYWPAPLEFIVGSIPKTFNVSLTFFIMCSLGSSILKWIFYQGVGLAYGVIPSTAGDEFWLYDYPINPTNVPSVMIFNKPKDITPEQMLDRFRSKLEHPVHNHRTQIKAIKILGKHFLQKIPDQELAQWKKDNLRICWDIKTEKDLTDFMIKLKVEH